MNKKPDELDIDRLHEGNHFKWGGGETTARIMELVGAIQVGNTPLFFCRAKTQRDWYSYSPMIADRFKEGGIKIIRIRYNDWEVEYDNKIAHIRFITYQHPDRILRGYDNYSIIEFNKKWEPVWSYPRITHPGIKTPCPLCRVES